MDIVIIGGSGQLGKTLFSILRQEYNTLSFSKSDLSITDGQKVTEILGRYKPKYVINCSAYTKVELAELEFKKAESINFYGIKNLCSACKKIQSTLIHFSTDYVYDGNKTQPYTEEDKTNPLNAYGVSKLKGDEYITRELKKFFIFRVSGIFSKHGDNFVKSMMRLCNKDTISIVNDQIMKPSSASFIAEFIKENLDVNNLNFKNVGVYNLTSLGRGLSWFEFAEIIFQEMIAQGLINRLPDLNPISSEEYKSKVNRPLFSVLSNDKLEKKFILQSSSYKHQLKKELKEIYDQL